MPNQRAIEIVSSALSKGELGKLLMGTPEYQFRSKFSPAQTDSDLTELLAVIYDGLDAQKREAARDALEKALLALADTYEGIEPLATCILLESLRRSDGRPTFGLPINDLAKKLQATIRKFDDRLRSDKSGGGRDWPDGLLGDMRRLSRNTERYGGPSFCM